MLHSRRTMTQRILRGVLVLYLAVALLSQVVRGSATNEAAEWLIKNYSLSPELACVLADAVEDSHTLLETGSIDWTPAVAFLIKNGPEQAKEFQEITIELISLLVAHNRVGICYILETSWEDILMWNDTEYSDELVDAFTGGSTCVSSCNLDTSIFELVKSAVESEDHDIALAFIENQNYSISSTAICALLDWNGSTSALLIHILDYMSLINLIDLYTVPWLKTELRKHVEDNIYKRNGGNFPEGVVRPTPIFVDKDPSVAIVGIAKSFIASWKTDSEIFDAMTTVLNILGLASPYYAICTLFNAAILLDSKWFVYYIRTIPYYQRQYIAHMLYFSVQKMDWDKVGYITTMDTYGLLSDSIYGSANGIAEIYRSHGMSTTLQAFYNAARSLDCKVAGLAFATSFLNAYSNADETVPISEFLNVGGFWGTLAQTIEWAYNTFSDRFSCYYTLPAICLTATLLNRRTPLLGQPLNAVTAAILYETIHGQTDKRALLFYILDVLPDVTPWRWSCIAADLPAPAFMQSLHVLLAEMRRQIHWLHE